MSSPSPLLERSVSEPFAQHGDRVISVGEFLGDVARAGASLPDARYLINACEDRYRFLVSFFAALAEQRTSLLPASRTEAACRYLCELYPGAAVLTNEGVLPEPGIKPGPASSTIAAVPDNHLAAIAFTSGSSGEPQPNAKSWGALRMAARAHAAWLAPQQGGHRPLVATVPPWHMYGLEWSVLVASVAPLVLYCGESFYPGDLRRAIARLPEQRILVTTPVHLRAMLRAANDHPRVETIVCATAPLDAELATRAELALGGDLLEIYGCSETGTLAYRATTQDDRWTLFDSFDLTRRDGVTVASAGFLPAPVPLADRIELLDPRRFHLLGRLGDLVKVGGKRASVGDLTGKMLALPGVEDAVVFVPGDGNGDERPAAFVVAPSLKLEEIRRHLAAVVDPVFMPRPLRLVGELPRSSTGKLTREALNALLQTSSPDSGD